MRTGCKLIALVLSAAAFWVAEPHATARGPGLTTARAADEAWLAEFAELCSKTQDAMALSREELTTLVERCDKLKPEIEKLDATQRKVYSRRLKACRDLYQFVLDSADQSAAPKS